MLIDVSFFTKGPRHIFNARPATATTIREQACVNEAIDGYIEFFQKNYLKNMLGDDLAKQIEERLKVLEGAMNPEKSTLDIVIGKLRESYADYIFYQIVKYSNEQATMTGLVQLKCANTYANTRELLVSTWNRMVENNGKFLEWVLSEECPYKVKIEKSMLTPINVLNL